MATENVQITLKINADGATATLKNFEGKIISSTVPVNKLKEALGGIPVAARKAGASMNVSKKDFDSFAKSVGGFTTKTGAASASALELGRVVSDMPYGIRGVANNISQFASMMAMSARATDAATGKAIGLSGALKGLWASLMGPLGILLAIQAVISAVDYFYGGAKKATEATNNYKDSAKELSTALKDLYLDQDGVNTKIEEYIKYIDLKNRLDVEQEKNTEKLLGIGEKITKSREKEKKTNSLLLVNRKALADEEIKWGKSRKTIVNGYIKEIKRLEKAETSAINETKRLEKERFDILSEGIDISTQLTNAKAKTTEAEKGTLLWLNNKIAVLKRERAAVAKTREEYDEKTKAIKKYQEMADAIDGGKKAKKKEKIEKISPFKTPKELEIDVENNLSAIQQLQRKTELINAKSAEDKLEIELYWEKKAIESKRQLELDTAQEKYDKYIKNLNDKFNAYEKSLKDEKGLLSKADENAIKEARKLMEGRSKLAFDEIGKTTEEIKEKYGKLFPFWEVLAKARRKALSGKDDSGEEENNDGDDIVLRKKLEKYQEYADMAKKILGSVTSFIDGEYDRELAIEKNKTNAINNELNQRLLNENLSKTQRQNIQNQIAQNDEALRKKQEAIEKKRFETNKAFAIALAVVDTASSALKAYGSQLVVGDPTSIFRAKIAAGIATAIGLAQVATIARQKFVSSAGAKSPILSGSAGGSGGGDRGFNFNLVGNTQANQIADAIQGRFKQPLKAFVVSRDITTQQELDANIKGSASF